MRNYHFSLDEMAADFEKGKLMLPRSERFGIYNDQDEVVANCTAYYTYYNDWRRISGTDQRDLQNAKYEVGFKSDEAFVHSNEVLNTLNATRAIFAQVEGKWKVVGVYSVFQ